MYFLDRKISQLSITDNKDAKAFECDRNVCLVCIQAPASNVLKQARLSDARSLAQAQV